MVETEIAITVNRKSDIELVEKIIIEKKMRFPVYIREYEFSYQINLTSDYEEWELDSAILDCFPEYEYTKDLEKGRKEIRIQVFRYQDEYSTDGWGRPIENPLNETKYLVRKSNKKAEKFSPKIKVLFEDNEQYYHINIVDGINKANNEKGFLLLDNFKNNNDDKSGQILKDKLYKSTIDAFHSGFGKLPEFVNSDFGSYLEEKKKAIREVQKIPRKIIRDFVNACNCSNEIDVLKNLADNIIFERRKNWQDISKTEGIDDLKTFLKSSDQQLYGKNFKIRSSWDFNLPSVTIGIKYFPTSDDPKIKLTQKYEQIKFRLENNKIVSVLHEG